MCTNKSISHCQYKIIGFINSFHCGSHFWTTWTRFIQNRRADTAKFCEPMADLYTGRWMGLINTRRHPKTRIGSLSDTALYPWSLKTQTRCFEMAEQNCLIDCHQVLTGGLKKIILNYGTLILGQYASYLPIRVFIKQSL